MEPDQEEQRAKFMSRQESRKLLMMAVVLLVMLGYMFKSAFPTGPADSGPEVRIGRKPAAKTKPHDDGMLDAAEAPPHVGPFQDAKRALAAKIAHEQAKEREERGELKKVTRESFRYDPSLLDDVKDGELDKVEEPAFYMLAARVHFMTDEELKQAPKTVGTFTWNDLRSPEGRAEARGKFKTVVGRFLVPLWQRVLEKQPNEAGTELPWVWQGVFRVQNRGYVVSITDKNFEPQIGISGDAVELTGAFLKIYRYETAQGEKSFPHLIVKNMHRAPKPASWNYMQSPIMWAVVIGFVIVSVLTFVYARGSRASAERVDEWRRKKVISRAKQAAKAGDFDRAREHKPDAKADAAAGDGQPIGDPVAESPPGAEAKPSPDATATATPDATATADAATTTTSASATEAAAPDAASPPDATSDSPATTETSDPSGKPSSSIGSPPPADV